MERNAILVDIRGQDLRSMQRKTTNLAEAVGGFRKSGNRVRKQSRWEELRVRVCLIMGVTVLLAVFVVPLGKSPLVSAGLENC